MKRAMYERAALTVVMLPQKDIITTSGGLDDYQSPIELPGHIF